MSKRWNPNFDDDELFEAVKIACEIVAQRKGAGRKQRKQVVEDLISFVWLRCRKFEPGKVNLNCWLTCSANWAWADYWRTKQNEIQFKPLLESDEVNKAILIEEHPGFREVEERVDTESQGDGADECY